MTVVWFLGFGAVKQTLHMEAVLQLGPSRCRRLQVIAETP